MRGKCSFSKANLLSKLLALESNDFNGSVFLANFKGLEGISTGKQYQYVNLYDFKSANVISLKLPRMLGFRIASPLAIAVNSDAQESFKSFFLSYSTNSYKK